MNNKYMIMANQLMDAGYMPQGGAKPMGLPQQQIGMFRSMPITEQMQSMGQPIRQQNQMMGPMSGIMMGRNFGQPRTFRR